MKKLVLIKKIFAVRTLKPTEKIIMAALISNAAKDMKCSASLSEIAKFTGLWKSTVSNNLTKLTERGCISMNKEWLHNEGREYRINIEAACVPREVPSPRKTKSTARQVYKFGTPTTDKEKVLSLVISRYKRILPELGGTQNLTEKDAEKFIKMLEKSPHLMNISWWEEYFTEIRNCSWLMGKNPRKWLPSFTYIIDESTMLKVKAGCYRPIKSVPAYKESAEEYAERLYEKLFAKSKRNSAKKEGE